uniref:Transportin-3 n=1 Tax=Corethron hystrix TaxID=216773 RepID=A0A7S1BAL8_9STRA
MHVQETTQAPDQQNNLLLTLVENLVQCALDHDARVQVAAMSALGVVVEHFQQILVPFLQPIYQHLMQCLAMYTGRSLLILYDVMGVLADVLGPVTATPQLLDIYLPPLLTKWETMLTLASTHNTELDRSCLPLLESLAFVASASGSHLQSHALRLFNLCMATTECCTLHVALLQSEPNSRHRAREEDSDATVCALDVLDGVVEALGSSFPSLLEASAAHGPAFPSLLRASCIHDAPSVRMSAFALLGDLARRAPQTLGAEALGEMLARTVENVGGELHVGVCNNAVWALGEVAVRCGRDATLLQPHAPQILQRLVPLLRPPATGISPPGLAENVAAALGRLAGVDHRLVGPVLEEPRLFIAWCDGLARVADPQERRDAFVGLVAAIRAQPGVLVGTVTGSCGEEVKAGRVAVAMALVFAVASWHVPLSTMLEEEGEATVTGGQPQHLEEGNGGARGLTSELLYGPSYRFVAFPEEMASTLGKELQGLLVDLREALMGGGDWDRVQKQCPVNVRKLFREHYQLMM